jgi:hypothetical protein
MIFWDGSKMFVPLRDGGAVQGVFFDYRVGKFNRNLKALGGRGLIERFAIGFRSEIVFMDRLPTNDKFRRQIVVDRIPIVSEHAENFPERFAIRTKNIDLLRELISQGKKVSWFFPDIYTQANYLGLLSFEHVFIDPVVNTHVVYPNGEIKEASEAVYTVACRGKNWGIQYSRKIGFNMGDIHKRIDWRGMARRRWRRKQAPIKNFLNKEMMVNLYNIFSITYLIWRQSKLEKSGATSALRKSVLKK